MTCIKAIFPSSILVPVSFLDVPWLISQPSLLVIDSYLVSLFRPESPQTALHRLALFSPLQLFLFCLFKKCKRCSSGSKWTRRGKLLTALAEVLKWPSWIFSLTDGQGGGSRIEEKFSKQACKTKHFLPRAIFIYSLVYSTYIPLCFLKNGTQGRIK